MTGHETVLFNVFLYILNNKFIMNVISVCIAIHHNKQKLFLGAKKHSESVLQS